MFGSSYFFDDAPTLQPQKKIDVAASRDLDQMAYLKAAMNHQDALTDFARQQQQLSPEMSVADPVAGKPGLAQQAAKWMEDYDR